MKRIAEPLEAMGASFVFARGDGLPMTIRGGDLQGIAWNTRSASAQTKSAILLAGLSAGVRVTVVESRKSRDHTERMLESMGVAVTTHDTTVSLGTANSIGPLELTVPADPSSAAYFIAFGILRGKGEIVLPGVCVNETRTGFIGAMRAMGGDVEYSDRDMTAGDESATITARPSRLGDGVVTEEMVPSMIDELPLLACVAAAAGVKLEVRGAGELRVKESDRIAIVVSNLQAIGANAEELPDGFRVNGGARRLAGMVRTAGDHRIAMSFGIIGALHGNAIEVDEPECVAVSYPRFWTDLATLRE